MLRPTEYEPLLDERAGDRLQPVSDSLRPRTPFAFRLRRRLGHALIDLGRLVAADPRRLRRTAQRPRAY